MRIYDGTKAVDVPILKDGLLYIYVLENAPQGNFKIGRSSNMQQRLRALSGSNTGGNKIIRCAVSDPTYLYTIEHIVQDKFSRNRIEGTEWFLSNDLSFQEIVAEIDKIFASDSYTRCNEIRKAYVEQQLAKGNTNLIPSETGKEKDTWSEQYETNRIYHPEIEMQERTVIN